MPKKKKTPTMRPVKTMNVTFSDRIPVPKEGQVIIYLAAPFFNPEQIERVRVLEEFIESIPGILLHSPMRDGVICPKDAVPQYQQAVFDVNVETIKVSDIIVAILDAPDSGTIYEAGYGRAAGVLTIGLYMTDVKKVNLMLSRGFTCMLHYQKQQALFKKFLTDYVDAKNTLDVGLVDIRRADLALAAEIQQSAAELNEKQKALQLRGAQFDKQMSAKFQEFQDYHHFNYQVSTVE